VIPRRSKSNMPCRMLCAFFIALFVVAALYPQPAMALPVRDAVPVSLHAHPVAKPAKERLATTSDAAKPISFVVEADKISIANSSNTRNTGQISPDASAQTHIASTHVLPAVTGSNSPSQLFRNARGGSHPIGLVELFEWVLFLVLIAPGTFPALSCIVLACAGFWRRRSTSIWPSRRIGALHVAEISPDPDLEQGWAQKSRRRAHAASSEDGEVSAALIPNSVSSPVPSHAE
jgi:hypothetical protein